MKNFDYAICLLYLLVAAIIFSAAVSFSTPSNYHKAVLAYGGAASNPEYNAFFAEHFDVLDAGEEDSESMA